MKIIRYFVAEGFRDGELMKLTSNCPYELDRSAYHWFDQEGGDTAFYVEFKDGSIKEYKL